MKMTRKLSAFIAFSLTSFILLTTNALGNGDNRVYKRAPRYRGSVMTLPRAIAYALKTAPDVLIPIKVRRASFEGVERAKASFFPTVDINAGYGREKSRNSTTAILGTGEAHFWRRESGISVRQLLFDGDRALSEVERNRAKTVADSYKVWGSAEAIALRVAGSYIDIVRSRRLVEIARQNREAHRQIYNKIKERGDRGVGREADTIQARGRYDLSRANLLAVRNLLADAKANYYRYTSLVPNRLRTPPTPSARFLPRSRRLAIRQALRNHPLLRSSIADVEEAKAQHRAAMAVSWPQIDFLFGANSNRHIDGAPGINQDVFGMLQLHYNVFKGGADVARQRQTAYLTQEASEIRNRTYRQVVENMTLVWNEMYSERARLPYLRGHRYASIQTVVAYKKQFDLGKRTLLDLLDAEREAFRSRSSYVRSYYDLLLSKYRVLEAKGRLIACLKLRLPAEAHVPYEAAYIRDNLLVAPVTMGQVVEENSGLPYERTSKYQETETTKIVDPHPIRSNLGLSDFSLIRSLKLDENADKLPVYKERYYQIHNRWWPFSILQRSIQVKNPYRMLHSNAKMEKKANNKRAKKYARAKVMPQKRLAQAKQPRKVLSSNARVGNKANNNRVNISRAKAMPQKRLTQVKQPRKVSTSKAQVEKKANNSRVKVSRSKAMLQKRLAQAKQPPTTRRPVILAHRSGKYHTKYNHHHRAAMRRRNYHENGYHEMPRHHRGPIHPETKARLRNDWDNFWHYLWNG